VKLTLSPTPQVGEFNGLTVRYWTGADERGTPVDAIIALVRVHDDGNPADAFSFDVELSDVAEPGECDPAIELQVLRQTVWQLTRLAGLSMDALEVLMDQTQADVSRRFEAQRKQTRR
jgi:hypothetical protein